MCAAASAGYLVYSWITGRDGVVHRDLFTIPPMYYSDSGILEFQLEVPAGVQFEIFPPSNVDPVNVGSCKDLDDNGRLDPLGGIDPPYEDDLGDIPAIVFDYDEDSRLLSVVTDQLPPKAEEVVNTGVCPIEALRIAVWDVNVKLIAARHIKVNN